MKQNIESQDGLIWFFTNVHEMVQISFSVNFAYFVFYLNPIL